MSILTKLFAPRTDDRRFPSIPALERAAQGRIPRFAHQYMSGGIGREDGLRRNVSEFDNVRFVPQYLREYEPADLTTKILGQKYAAPIGPGPIGLTGLMWPGAPLHSARAARAHDLPTCLSTYATSSIEDVGAVAGPAMWFQLYPFKDVSIDEDLLKRFKAVGGEVLLITVDIPGSTRRERDIASGLSLPPAQDWRTYLQAALRPRWALNTLRNGTPEFVNMMRYAPEGMDQLSALEFLGGIGAGHIGPERLRHYREIWDGKIVVKGLLSVEDARIAADCGMDGIVVSNHGGRQLDAAPTALEMLPQIRQAVGGQMAILADGGVRYGSDILKLLAMGADFVLLGRAMTFAVSAMGPEGPKHALHILLEEMKGTLGQLGCEDLSDIANYLQNKDIYR
ncbi:MAG: alpha-hydroxy acid oxidase [Pseudomonadota bacterium]